jgi:hypothetical protein
MKHRNYRITLSTLRARAIYEAVTQFTQQHPLPRSRGRKPIYSEALILTLALLRTARRLSYRQLLFCVAPEVLPEEPLPALGTLMYRLQTIPDERWHALLHGLAAQGIARGGGGGVMCLWCLWMARVWVLTRRFMRSFVVGQRYVGYVRM